MGFRKVWKLTLWNKFFLAILLVEIIHLPDVMSCSGRQISFCLSDQDLNSFS